MFITTEAAITVWNGSLHSIVDEHSLSVKNANSETVGTYASVYINLF